MTKNQFPEGVGKKIVEALKRQAEADIAPSVSVKEPINDIAITEQDISEIDFDSLHETPMVENNNAKIIEDSSDNIEAFNIRTNKKINDDVIESLNPDELKPETSEILQEHEDIESLSSDSNENIFKPLQDDTVVKLGTFTQKAEQNVQNDPVPQTPVYKTNNNTGIYQNTLETVPYQTQEESPAAFTFASQNSSVTQQFNTNVPLKEEPQQRSSAPSVTVKIPTNVAVLKNLIASLPVGVTKQTGAQIIRQTLEAMGLPMAGVLKEAQELQENLNTNTRECMLKIQEYKTNIMMLEQSVQEYQKNVTQINDLVSLFLLTDRK